MRLAPSRYVTKPNQEEVAARRAVLLNFMNNGWSQVAPKAIPPFGDDGKTILNEKNFLAFAAVLHAHGTRPITDEVLRGLVEKLDKDGKLEHFEREVKVQPTRREAAKSASDLTRLMNSKDLSPIQGFGAGGEKEKERGLPKYSQEQIESQARHDLNENAVMGEINSAIQTHRGQSHGDTDAQRKILLRIRDEGVNSNTPNAEILKQIEAKRSEMVTWDAQRAIREVYAPKFRERGIDLSQRTPSKFGDSQ